MMVMMCTMWAQWLTIFMKASAELWAGAQHMHIIVWGENIKTGVVESLTLIKFLPKQTCFAYARTSSRGSRALQQPAAWGVGGQNSSKASYYTATSVFVNLPHAQYTNNIINEWWAFILFNLKTIECIEWNVVFGLSGMFVNTNKIGPASVSAPHTSSSNE